MCDDNWYYEGAADDEILILNTLWEHYAFGRCDE